MAINWTPTRSEEIRQCVETLMATTPGTVPYARAQGVETLVDMPEPVVAQRIRVAAVRAVRVYEPRARVRSVEIAQGDGPGALVPSVVYEEVS